MNAIALLFLVSLSPALRPQSQPDIETLHRTIQLDNSPYDAILTRPSSPGKHPAVFIIGGLGCYSLDNLKPDDPYTHLIDGLTRRGFVTMRVDKNGEGRSGGPPCDSPQSDLQLAVRRSVAGLEALAASDFVDSAKIFIFAHSIGPLEGVLAAQKLSFRPRGFLAVETIGKTWMEYTLENARRQALILGMPYDKADHLLRMTELCQHRFLIDRQTPGQVIKETPECRDHVGTFGVSSTYLQQIAALDLAAEWKKVDLPVLVTYGTSDPTTSGEESRYLVNMINSFHPGRAEYMEFAGMGHGLDLSPTPRAWLEAIQKHQHGPFDQDFLERAAAWMESQLSK
jgi:alpha-beta hydrolase superfamily lysophospholipase